MAQVYSNKNPIILLIKDLLGLSFLDRIIEYSEALLDKDLADNKAIGKHGASAIISNGPLVDGKATVLTICNTGSLATSGYGTALGVIRSLHEESKLGMEV